MLSIHSYYVGEFQAGMRSSERILNSNAPDNIKKTASQNLSFYIKSLSDHCEVRYTKLHTDQLKENWSLFNPTIIPYQKGFLVLARASNYQIDSLGYYNCPPEDNGIIKTTYFKFLLDSNLSITDVSLVPLIEYPRTNYPVDNVEDARIFKTKDSYWISGTIRNIDPYDGNCRIAICKYDPILNKIESPEVIPTDLFHEKNWMPISIAEDVVWLHHPNIGGKTSIIYKDGVDYKLRYNNCNFTAAENFRGGSQLFLYNNKYYCLTHEVTTKENNGRVYYHRFVEWDMDLSLARYSKAFFLKENRTIEFAAGFCIKDNYAHITFGVEDKQAWIASIPLEKMMAMFDLT